VEIFKQNNQNECGICVLASLVQHFYHKECKTELMNDANISEDGLSIYDFELLAQRYGIFPETYELN
jgi:ABC-type bacteriocin/lantibiotic exporter with double-glycine peptidase domain